MTSERFSTDFRFHVIGHFNVNFDSLNYCSPFFFFFLYNYILVMPHSTLGDYLTYGQHQRV